MEYKCFVCFRFTAGFMPNVRTSVFRHSATYTYSHERCHRRRKFGWTFCTRYCERTASTSSHSWCRYVIISGLLHWFKLLTESESAFKSRIGWWKPFLCAWSSIRRKFYSTFAENWARWRPPCKKRGWGRHQGPISTTLNAIYGEPKPCTEERFSLSYHSLLCWIQLPL